MSGEHVLWLSMGIALTILVSVVSHVIEKTIRAKTKTLTRQMKKQSVWRLSLEGFFWGILLGVVITMVFGYHYLRVTPDSFFHGHHGQISEPEAPRQFTNATQDELADEVLAAMTQENKAALRRASEHELYAMHYDLSQWIRRTWFTGVPRWQSHAPDEDSWRVLYLVWQRLQAE